MQHPDSCSTQRPAGAVQGCAGSAAFSTGLLVLGLSALADSMALRWCSTAPLGCGIILLASAVIGIECRLRPMCSLHVLGGA